MGGRVRALLAIKRVVGLVGNPYCSRRVSADDGLCILDAPMAPAVAPAISDEAVIATNNGTMAYYDGFALEYARATLSSDLSALYPQLLDRLTPGGLVLDAGSGSGRDILAFLERGFRVEAFDASVQLAASATRLTGVPVEVARFEDWQAPPGRYDGIWCFASLLHVPRQDLPGTFHKLARALKTGGWLFASFKRGKEDTVDELGRRYTNVEVQTMSPLFTDSELIIERTWEEAGPALAGSATWVYVLARREGAERLPSE